MLRQAELVHFPKHMDPNGTLCVYECGRHVDFAIQRVFAVFAENGEVRGEHAHKQCTQLLVCVSGKIRVTCDDGATATDYLLDDMSVGLLIPPGIWAKETYVEGNALLMVLCDRAYEADDYIRDYSEYQIYAKDRRNPIPH